MSFQTNDNAVIYYFTNLISHNFGFVLTDRNIFNNLVINTILPYKNKTIMSNNNQNKSMIPNANSIIRLKILWL